MLSVKEVSSTIFKVFGMTRPGMEPRSPGPLANTLPTSPCVWVRVRTTRVCVYVCVCVSLGKRLFLFFHILLKTDNY